MRGASRHEKPVHMNEALVGSSQVNLNQSSMLFLTKAAGMSLASHGGEWLPETKEGTNRRILGFNLNRA